MKHGDIHAHMERLDMLFSWWDPLLTGLSLLRHAMLLTAFGMALDLPHARDAFWTVLIMQGLTLAGWLLGYVVIEREFTRFARRVRGGS